jgi:hypothetical protein
MARKLRRLRNLNLEEEDLQPIEYGHVPENENEDGLQGVNENDDDLQGMNENDDDLQNLNENDDDLHGPPDVDGLLARLPRHHPRTPIKIICKFHVFSLQIKMQCQINLFHVCRAKWCGEASFRGFWGFKSREFTRRKGNCGD